MEIMLFDFFKNERLCFASSLQLSEAEVKNSAEYELIPYPESKSILLVSRTYLVKPVKAAQNFYLLVRCFQGNKEQTKLEIKKEFKQPADKIKLFKSCGHSLVVFDASTDELISWNFLSQSKELTQIQLDLTDFSILFVQSYELESNFIIFFLLSSQDSLVRTLHYDTRNKMSVGKILKPSEKEIALMHSIVYNNLVRLNDMYVQTTLYKAQPESLFINVYQRKQISNEFCWVGAFSRECLSVPLVKQDPRHTYAVAQFAPQNQDQIDRPPIEKCDLLVLLPGQIQIQSQ